MSSEAAQCPLRRPHGHCWELAWSPRGECDESDTVAHQRPDGPATLQVKGAVLDGGAAPSAVVDEVEVALPPQERLRGIVMVRDGLLSILSAANPNVEVVSVDGEGGKITLREKQTGRQVTVDLDDIKQGRIAFGAEAASNWRSGPRV